jgi:iron complex outermembrane receptor protein
MEANNLNSNYLTVPGRLGSGGIRNVTEVSAQGVALTHDILVTESSDYWFGPDTFFRQSKPSNDIIDLSFEYDGDDYILKGSIGTTSADNDLFVWGLSGRVGPEAVASGLVSPDARTTLDISNGRLQQSFVNFDPSDPASYPAAANGARVRVEGTDETFAQIDYIVDLDSEFVPRIHIGGKFKAHEKVLDQYSFNEEWEAIFASQNVETYADLPTTVRSGLFSEQAGPNSLTTLPVFDMNQIIALGNSSIPNDVFAANRQTQNAFYRLEEDIFAAYIMAEFEGDKFSGNIGLRFVDTSLDSSGWEFANGNATQITTVSNDYTEILPSFNISYNITEDLLFRGAYSIAIARPNYADLAGGLNVTEETRTGSAGNPNLDPWKASQFDAGLEWYFDSTSLLGFTFFYKDLDTFVERAGSDEIVPGLEALGEFEIVRPRNGGSAELNGLEISYQTEFAYGFGLLANYTHTKADVVRLNGEEGDLPDNSETMWNFTPYWANESFEARVMVNHRGAYFNGFNRGSANFVDDFTSVDVAFTWHISESLDLNIQGLNVTNELWTARHSLEARDGIWRQLAENGSRWFAGINYRF